MRIGLFDHVENGDRPLTQLKLASPIARSLPAPVRAGIERQVEDLGVNYLLTYLFLGTMSLADALRSLDLFASEVMPHLAKL